MWRRIELNIEDEALSENVSSELWELGAKGVEERDAATFSEFRESAFGKRERAGAVLIAYFPPGTQANVVDPLLERYPAIDLMANGTFDEADWQSSWRQYFEPSRISRRITIRPSWDDRLPPGDHKVVLVVDPGLAFGTGTHETTRMCIREIDRYLEQDPQASFLDVGCGSGILSMCAARLGSGQVLGIDHDEVALEVARQNWSDNGLGEPGEAPFEGTPLADVAEVYTLVVANMLSKTLLKLRDDLLRVVAPGGRLVLSGILRSELAEFLPHFALGELEREALIEDGQWVAIRLARA